LEEILANHRSIARGVASKFPVVAKFKRYLSSGYYPFYKTARGGYLDRIAQVVTQTLERDWPETEDVTLATIKKTEKMLMILSASCPQVPRMNELYAELETEPNLPIRAHPSQFVILRLLAACVLFASPRVSLFYGIILLDFRRFRWKIRSRRNWKSCGPGCRPMEAISSS
ncbi:MAG: hypothetical protein KBT68_01675, partial [bacterium]|nr:hypothetical protein [Candidatus Colisoma equi]